MIPAAALGLKKNRSGTVASSTSGKDEDPSPSLGHSEVSAVQHSPCEVVKPELGQRRENDGEIASTVRGKESGNVLNEEPPAISEKSVCDSGCLEEKAGSLAGESGLRTRDGEVLAGEASGDDTNGASPSLRFDPLPPVCANVMHVTEAGDSRPVAGEDSTGGGVLLALEDDSHPCALEAEVDAADA